MDNEQKKKLKRSEKGIIIVTFSLLVIAIIGISYAWLMITKTGTKVNVIKTGDLELIYENESNGIFIDGDNAQPMIEEDGLKLDGYQFTLHNTGTIDTNYTIYLDDVSEYTKKGEDQPVQVTNRMNDQFVRFSLNYEEENTTKLLNTTGSHPNRVLYTGTLSPQSTKNFTLKLWIDENATNAVMDTVFAGKIRVEAIQAKSDENP